MKNYNGLDNNEDKYREVYKISEAIKKYKFNKTDYEKALIEIGNGLIYKNVIDSAIKWYEKDAKRCQRLLASNKLSYEPETNLTLMIFHVMFVHLKNLTLCILLF